MRTVSLFFLMYFSMSVFAETYKVSQIKFQNFRAYENYEIGIDDIQRILKSFSAQNPTFEQSGLFVLAAQLAEVYRSKGLSFHRVEVQLGDPTRLVLVPGVIALVDVRGNSLYNSKQLLPFFESIKGKLVDDATLQESMARMNTLPGLQGFAFLSFGQKPGQAVLNVSASQESWGQFSTRINNYGTQSTGDYRVLGQLTLNNPLKLSEQWQLGASISDATANWSSNISVDFHQKGNSIWSMRGLYQQMALEQDLAVLNLEGWQGSGQFGYQTTVVQKINKTLTVKANSGYMQQSLENEALGDLFNINLQDVYFNAGVEGDFSANKTYLGYKFSADSGWLMDYNAPVQLDEDYWALLKSQFSLAQSITGIGIQNGIDLKLKLGGQYALTTLPSHRRYSLSGQSKLGAYKGGVYTADTAIFGEAGLTLLNLTIGPVHVVFQGVGQVGWGQIGSTDLTDLYTVGSSFDVYVGPISGQVKAFSNLDFSDYVIWFETSIVWPSGG